MKTAINTRTQEEYDALYVRCIEKPGEEFICRDVTVGKTYKVKESNGLDEDYRMIDDDGRLRYYLQRFFEIIPYTEFAKANIVEEPDYRALYLEGRELLDESRLQIEYLHGKFQATGTGNSVLSRIETFLTKHNDLTNHKDETKG